MRCLNCWEGEGNHGEDINAQELTLSSLQKLKVLNYRS
jgi:hypothetical protein